MPNLHSERHRQIKCGRQIGGQRGSVEYKYIDYKSQTRSIRGVREKCIVSLRECSQGSLHHMFVYCTLLPEGKLDIFFSFQGFSCIGPCWAAGSMPQQRTSDAKAIQKKRRTNVLDFLQFTLNRSSSTLVLQLVKH